MPSDNVARITSLAGAMPSYAGMETAMPDMASAIWLSWAVQHPTAAAAKLVQTLEGFFNGDAKKVLAVLNSHSQDRPGLPADPGTVAVWNAFTSLWNDLHPSVDWTKA